MFRHQNPVTSLSTVFKQGLERRSDRGFVGHADRLEPLKGFVVGFDRLVG